VLEGLADAGRAADERLSHALDWLLSQQDERGRWRNRYAYTGKLIADIDAQGRPSKWVTLRACAVLRAMLGD
ncbi:MAG TPA: nitrogen fixation protein NifH, partial [Anaerolineae bacterium]|nr:nitrogen fixation protein NifH [Anaerolineae bacterium]